MFDSRQARTWRLARSAWAQSVFVSNIGQPDGGIRVRGAEAPASGRDRLRAQFRALWLPPGQSVAQVVAALAPQLWRMAGRTAAQVVAALTLVLGLGMPAMAQSPTVNIEGVPSTSERAFTATFIFSENVTGFALADIDLGSSPWQPDGSSRRCLLHPSGGVIDADTGGSQAGVGATEKCKQDAGR